MDATTIDTAAAATPTPTPAPAPAAAPAPSYNDGGAATSSGSGGTITQTFKNLDWVQVGFGVLGSAALFYAIYYFRYNIQMNKTFVKSVEARMDELTIKVADVSSVLNTQTQQQDNLDIF
jgi:hypothetical protein